MKKIVLLSLLIATQFIQAQVDDTFFNKADTFFKTFVNNGRVKYSEIKKDSSTLDALIKDIANAKPSKSDVANFQAFYINAYNLTVIHGITANFPTKGPLSINGFFDRTKHNIAGEQLTLNSLENGILRKDFPKEPRFHFVLVCAGLGCPPIISEAYTPSKLESQLERQTKKAINDPTFIRFDKKRLKISQIFEWYTKDFTQFGSLVDFINKYRIEKVPAKTKVGFYPYDWTLNKI